MNIELKEHNGYQIAELVSDGIEIRNSQDAVDLMGNCSYQGTTKIIIRERNLTPDFFELRTGIAGEILQKFSTYNVQLAIIGDFEKYPGKSLQNFIYESNKYKRINFVSSLKDAISILT